MEMTIDPSGRPGQARLMAEAPVARDGDEDRLVVAAQRGDRAAFGALYERFASMVHGVLLSRVSRTDVDDLVQDVFIIALERLTTLRTPSAFPAWLAAIARHRAVDRHRAAPTLPLPDDLRAADACPDFDARAILDVVRQLPDAYRETLTLRLVEGMTGPEIAARTGLTEGSVRVNLHRGMNHLREKLTQKRMVP